MATTLHNAKCAAIPCPCIPSLPLAILCCTHYPPIFTLLCPALYLPYFAPVWSICRNLCCSHTEVCPAQRGRGRGASYQRRPVRGGRGTCRTRAGAGRAAAAVAGLHERGLPVAQGQGQAGAGRPANATAAGLQGGRAAPSTGQGWAGTGRPATATAAGLRDSRLPAAQPQGGAGWAATAAGPQRGRAVCCTRAPAGRSATATGFRERLLASRPVASRDAPAKGLA